ncbi:hypothetical protein GW756_00380 [bacterium]|nr:hypothetical protein [bacterium]NCQ54814.1 hypothetical protein [Candidatus Parcubacteria bacterium]NCS66858.1 hypothetical protein [Candidatus Peregrinibacteria bacterium]NCS95804.1 hypothetical protein [bacterium]
MSFEINDNLLALIYLVGFGILWVGFMTLLAKVTGWSRLYAQLGSHASPQIIGGKQKTYRFVSGYINKTQYKNFLKVITTPYCLSVKAFFPFNIGHKPLVIPWDKISSIREDRTIFYNSAIVKLISPLNDELKLPKKIFLNNEHLPERLSISPTINLHENPYQ